MGWLGKAFLRCISNRATHSVLRERDSRQGEEPGKGPAMGTNLVDSLAVPTRASQKATVPARNNETIQQH